MDSHDLKNFDFLSSIIKKGDIIVDVGANHGAYTDFFKTKLEGTGKIYTIELHPSTFNLLQKKYDKDDNIIVINKAVSNLDGEIPYYQGNGDCLHNILGHDVNYRVNNKIGNITSIRLDTLLEKVENIDLIKIDVEGAELMVLEGIEKVIDRVNNILVECHLSKDWESIKNLLINKYKLKCFNNSADDILDREITIDTPNIAYQCFCKNVK
jgi:FkbM family methyltransferase